MLGSLYLSPVMGVSRFDDLAYQIEILFHEASLSLARISFWLWGDSSYVGRACGELTSILLWICGASN